MRWQKTYPLHSRCCHHSIVRMAPSPPESPANPDEEVSWDDVVRRVSHDANALAALFEKYYSAILRYCSHRAYDLHVGQDLASETFMQVSKHVHHFSGRTEADFRAWLYAIATTSIRAYARKEIRRKKQFAAAVQDGALTVDQASAAPERAGDTAMLYEAVGKLSIEQQEIVILRFFEGLKLKEIASVLDKKPGTVRVALSRALGKLRESLKGRF